MTSVRRSGGYWLLLFLLSSVLFPAYAIAADTGQALWNDRPVRSLSILAPQAVRARTLSLDVQGMQSRLSAARIQGQMRLTLPRPDGGFATFELADSGTLPLALQQRYPGIISLAGRDADGNRVRVDSSSRGFQAMVFGSKGVWVVRPETLGLGSAYISFFKADLPPPARAQLLPDVVAGARPLAYRPSAVTLTDTGETQRVYRLAMAADGEYVTAVGGGTVAGGLAAVTQAINRVNQVYETELGVHLTLVANNDQIIYTDATSDPYANTGDDIDTNQTVLDQVIGNANYDVGHVFTTGSGGIAGLGVTCDNSQKGRGTTGLPNPIGDAFYIDYVSHELGHEFGANHPFNSETGSCGDGNRSATTAYEPGSGSTILAYAGICAENDLQSHSNPYFHAISLNEIDTWIEGAGGACAAATASGDAAPVIAAGSLPPAALTIPMHTPITLSATATDADGDTLSYTWEQFDLGDPTNLTQGDVGNGPIVRSRPPTASGTQTFPAMAGVLSGTLDKGDTWAVTNRTLNFRLTVRDNHGVPGTPQYGRTTSADAPAITVTTAAGPFTVTQPNSAVTWQPSTAQTVTWNVANTDQAPVSCSSVTVRLSTDGGSTFPVVLAANTANDGSETVTLPAVVTTQARVKIDCDNNIFFDVSDTNFTIGSLPNIIFRSGFEPLPTLLDPGFEVTTSEGGSNSAWQGTDTLGGGTPFFSTLSGITPRNGNWIAWFGGFGSAGTYTQNASQSVTLGSFTKLYFNYWSRVTRAAPAAGDAFSVLVDGNVVATVDASTWTVESQYSPHSVDISAYTDNSVHTVKLEYAHANGTDANFYVDDVSISTTPIAP